MGGSIMRILLRAVLGLLLGLWPITHTQAAELQVLAGAGIAGPLKEIAAQFEAASGHTLAIRYGTTPELIKLAASRTLRPGCGSRRCLQGCANPRAVRACANLDVARVGIGVAVRSGAAKPDITTPEAFRQTLLKAHAVASIPASATGTLLAGVYERLGIAEEMQAKTKAQPGPAQMIEAVVKGEAEIAVFLTNVLADPRLDMVGPLPGEIQRELVYQTGLSASSREPDAAKAFIAHPMSPASAAVIRSKGITPG